VYEPKSRARAGANHQKLVLSGRWRLLTRSGSQADTMGHADAVKPAAGKFSGEDSEL